jgi:hypothetical protein
MKALSCFAAFAESRLIGPVAEHKVASLSDLTSKWRRSFIIHWKKKPNLFALLID